MTKFEEMTVGIENSLLNGHPSVSIAENPVLMGLKNGSLTAQEVSWILGQYSILPKRIVALLKAGAGQCACWPQVYSEIVNNNIAEEEGLRTEGIVHYDLLRKVLKKDLRLDVGAVMPSRPTEQFITNLLKSLKGERPEFVAGMLYALEDSAIPELRIVAMIAEGYVGLCGQMSVIDLDSFDDGELLEVVRRKRVVDYSLEDFFVIHWHDFEQCHQKRLWVVLSEYICTEWQCAEMERGFEYVVGEMDIWWQGMVDDIMILRKAKEIEASDLPDVFKRRAPMKLFVP